MKQTLLRGVMVVGLFAGTLATPAAAQRDVGGAVATAGVAQADSTRWIGRLPLDSNAPTNVASGEKTALQTYVAFDDGAFAWKKKGEIKLDGAGTAHLIRLTSQRWRADGEVDRPIWKHWLVVAMPDKPRSSTAVLVISGGRHREETPKDLPGEIATLLRVTGGPVIYLDNVPNQPLVLEGDGQSRIEDNILARTWVLAMRDNDATWIGQFPMAKAAIRAMDAADAFTRDELKKPIEGYFVAGGSKRGWTTWLAAATGDRRVRAIAPAVIDMLNMPAHTPHHFASYGFWAPALKDYVNNGIAEKFGSPGLNKVIAHVDPIGYVPAIGTMPTFLMHAGGDEFFPTDSARHYESLLTGPGTEHRHIRVMPNVGHGLKGSTAWLEVMTFFVQVREGREIPSLSWSVAGKGDEGELTVTTTKKPLSVTLWRVANAANRDFRIDQTGSSWEPTVLEPADTAGLRYVTKLEPPAKGWRASLVVATFDAGPQSPTPLTVSTRVFITPDTLPHAAAVPVPKPE